MEQAFAWAVLSPATGASSNEPLVCNVTTYPENKVDRVSVPGGRQPDWRRPWRELFRFHGTALKGVLLAPSTYLILGIYAGFLGLGAWGALQSFDAGINIPEALHVHA